MNTLNHKTGPLIDFDVNIKVKLAGLWTATTLCYLYGDYFQLYTPGKVESLIRGEDVISSPMMLFKAAIILAIPPLMIFLSLALKPKLNRILNIIFGLIFTMMMVGIALNSLTPWYTFYVFLALVEAMLTFIIVWQAFKWPRQVK